MNDQQNKIDNPLISIALCTYNGEKFLHEQLDSLLRQTYTNIEIVAVDDWSTDNTWSILEEYAAKYPVFRIFKNEKNLGYSRNFEKAIMLCKGDFIAVSDQDDIWKPEKIAICLQHMQDNLLVYSQSETIDKNGKSTGRLSIYSKFAYSGSDTRTNIIINYIWGHNIMFRKELVPLAFPLPEGNDYDWHLGIAALNYGKVKFIDQLLVLHRRHESNATAGYKKKITEFDKLHHRLKSTLTIKDLKHEAFFRKMLHLTEPETPFGKIRLFFFLIKNMNIVLTVSEKGITSKIFRIRKHVYC